MCEDSGAVDAMPGEGVMERLVEAVPGEFLCEEALDAGGFHDLGKLAVVTEDIGVPEFFASLAEFFLEEALAEEELTAEGFA